MVGSSSCAGGGVGVGGSGETGGVGVGGSGETGGVGVGGMGVVPSNLAVSMVAGISMSAPRGSRRLEETRDSPIYQPLNVPFGVATAVILFSQ